MGMAAQLRKIRDFDLYATLDKRAADFAGVPPESSLATKVKAVATNPRKLLIVVGVVVGFSAVVIVLFASGALGYVYQAIYEFWPGRSWTHVMRDRPWIYLVLAVGLTWMPWVGFLGGHVFW